MAENRPVPSALLREVIAATRAEPGERLAELSHLITGAGLAASEADELLASVQDSQQVTARLRRRTAELEALFSTARELVRLQDVTDVLRRLVERAHELMGTDVTYLSEVDNTRGDLRVRYSAGTVTPEFRDLLVPAGFGLASLVAGTREPAWVRDYTRMSDAPHDPAIDTAVRREGLVSFLGVPLAVGDEVLGALFACNRFAHDFTPDQVLLLSAFADHAAAVLHSARTLAESAEARAHAEAAAAELQRHLATTRIVSGIHEELTAAVVSGATLGDVVATVAERLGRRVWALDEAGRPIDGAAGSRTDLPSRRLLQDAMRQSQRSGHATAIVEAGRDWLVVVIVGADRVVGAMVAEGDDVAQDALARSTLERAAHVAALVSFKREAASAIRTERRARLLLGLVDGRPADQAPSLDSEVASAITGCAAVDVRGRTGVLSAAAAAAGEDALVAERDGLLIVAWTMPDVEAATERLRRALSDRLREPTVTAVARSSTGSLSGLGDDVERVVRDLRFLAPLGIRGATVGSDAFAPYHVLTSGEPESAERYVEGLLGPIREWDARRGTALVETLAAFFDAGESRRAAAEALRVHPNTVQQRLERIWALLDGDWTDPEYRFRVQAAVRLESLRRALRSADADIPLAGAKLGGKGHTHPAELA